MSGWDQRHDQDDEYVDNVPPVIVVILGMALAAVVIMAIVMSFS